MFGRLNFFESVSTFSRAQLAESVVFKIEISRAQRRENYSAVCLPFTVSIGARITSEFPVPNVRDERTRIRRKHRQIRPWKISIFPRVIPSRIVARHQVHVVYATSAGQSIDISFFFFLISRRRKNEKERIFSIFQVILILGENLIFFYPHCIINLIYMINL